MFQIDFRFCTGKDVVELLVGGDYYFNLFLSCRWFPLPLSLFGVLWLFAKCCYRNIPFKNVPVLKNSFLASGCGVSANLCDRVTRFFRTV